MTVALREDVVAGPFVLLIRRHVEVVLSQVSSHKSTRENDFESIMTHDYWYLQEIHLKL